MATDRLGKAIVGAAGRQGWFAVSRLADNPQVDARTLCLIDRGFSAEQQRYCQKHGLVTHTLDVSGDAAALQRVLETRDIVYNFAGPYYALGTAVLRAAIASRCHYVDVCDDADATLAMLRLHADARAAGMRALIGAGSAPGVTNVLARVAYDALPGPQSTPTTLVIAFAAPPEGVTSSILDHIVHSLRHPIVGAPPCTRWESLAPREITFPSPVGSVETVRFGHPEPITLRHFLAVDAELRGATIPSHLMRRAWSLAAATSESAAVTADLARQVLQEFVAVANTADRWGALHIEAWRGDHGLCIQTVSDESMESSTVLPCLTLANVLTQRVTEPGVYSPEALDPRHFFELGASTGSGRLFAYRLSREQSPQSISLRQILSQSRERQT